MQMILSLVGGSHLAAVVPIVVCAIATLGCSPGGFGSRYQGGGSFIGGDAVLCPDGNDVLIAQPGRQSLGNIFLLPITMGDIRTVVQSANYLGFPDVSPDGRTIVYVREESDVSAIWVSDITGANARRLTNSKFPEEMPIFSGDGKSIAFVRRMSLADPNYWESELFVIDLAGQSEKRLTEDHHADSPVRFSQDGGELYFVSDRSWKDPQSRGDSAQLFKISLAVLSISPVLQLDLRSTTGCDLSMDEKTVVFVTDPMNDFAYDVFTCNINGTNRQQRTKFRSYIGSVRFGFHSDRFALVEQRGGRGPANIFIYDLKSAGMQQVSLR